ncbi:DUF397 domain-containing protein [Streptomyces sp. 4N509B]|uniref:DUF397 domain-containing protein n=1 Tax=Streptomyces sp. 4N509B TaxID=3457413 RepID=UPI003FD03779
MDEELNWFKSSYSASPTQDCVETALLAEGVAVRDSKDPGGPSFRLTKAAWLSFTGGLRSGAFNDLG